MKCAQIPDIPLQQNNKYSLIYLLVLCADQTKLSDPQKNRVSIIDFSGDTVNNDKEAN